MLRSTLQAEIAREVWRFGVVDIGRDWIGLVSTVSMEGLVWRMTDVVLW